MDFKRAPFRLIACLILGIIISNIHGQTQIDLTQLSLEELMSLEVITIAKKPQMLSDICASVFVLSDEDIKRSGSRMIADALRISPGTEVTAIDANKWAISIRGFNDRFANKLLVLSDGRSAYISPFSGVYWDVQDFILEDISRIEIIRGPGASLWGANAVNGVINILSKSSKETQGGLISGGIGTSESEVYGRYGFKLGTNWYGRTHFKHHDIKSRQMLSDDRAGDQWSTSICGFRLDRTQKNKSKLTFQGNFYQGSRGRTIQSIDFNNFKTFNINEQGDVFGANTLMRWQKNFSKQSEFILQSYVDYSNRASEELNQKYILYDVDAQYRFGYGQYHEFMFGGEYRYQYDWLHGTLFTMISPTSLSQYLFSGFLQDEIYFLKRKMLITIGSKIEHNTMTGFEFQPTIRFLWKGAARHRIWGAISRAVRTPSRVERGASILAAYSPPGNLAIQGEYPLFGRILGNQDFNSEVLLAHELGYRFQPNPSISVDLSGFYNDYSHLRIGKLGESWLILSNSSYLEQDIEMTNGLGCHSYGFEGMFEWYLRSAFRLRVSYSYLNVKLNYSDQYEVDGKVIADYSDRQNITQQSKIWVSWNIAFPFKLDVIGHYITPNKEILDPLNIHLNTRLAWHCTKKINIAVTVQNLWEKDKIEFVSTFPGVLLHNATPTKVPQTVFAQVSYSW